MVLIPLSVLRGHRATVVLSCVLSLVFDQTAPQSPCSELPGVLVSCSDLGACACAWQVDGDLDADGDEEPLDDDWGLDEEHV